MGQNRIKIIIKQSSFILGISSSLIIAIFDHVGQWFSFSFLPKKFQKSLKVVHKSWPKIIQILLILIRQKILKAVFMQLSKSYPVLLDRFLAFLQADFFIIFILCIHIISIINSMEMSTRENGSNNIKVCTFKVIKKREALLIFLTLVQTSNSSSLWPVRKPSCEIHMLVILSGREDLMDPVHSNINYSNLVFRFQVRSTCG